MVPPNNSREISAICDNVTSSIYIINSRVKNLKSVIDNIGTGKDSQQLRNQIQSWQQEVLQKIKTSSEDLNKLTELARSANKQQRLQINKITSHCKDAINGFCKIEQVCSLICKIIIETKYLFFFVQKFYNELSH